MNVVEIQGIVTQALEKGYWSLTGDQMQTYTNAWRAGLAEQWRATVGWNSLVTPGKIVKSDVFGLSEQDCRIKIQRLLTQQRDLGAGIVTPVHQAFPKKIR